MSSLARRGLRATAAVAGITAAGVGLAGPAFAAPAAPEQQGADDVAHTPNAGSTPHLVSDPPRSGPQVTDLPPLFTVDEASVHTADRALPTPPPDRLPSEGDAANVEFSSTDVEYRDTAPHEQHSALQQLDAASMFPDVHGEVPPSAEGNDIRV